MVSPRNDVWEMSAEIRVTTQIRVMLLIGWCRFPRRHDQSEALPRSGEWRVISMEFLRSFLRRYFAGKPPMTSRNFVCFLRITAHRFRCTWSLMEYRWHCKAQEHAEKQDKHVNYGVYIFTYSQKSPAWATTPVWSLAGSRTSPTRFEQQEVF